MPSLDTLLIPQWPAPDSVRAVCTNRVGGVSQGAYTSMNLGLHVGDKTSEVEHNRQILKKNLGAHPVFLEQVHGTHILKLDASTTDGQVADAAITQYRCVACTVMVADCLPVLFCNRQGTLVAAAHAGWRGLADGVLEATVKAMLSRGCGAGDLLAWLGPCIGSQAFEVGDDVRSAFLPMGRGTEKCLKEYQQGKWLANLSGLARLRLQAMGVHAVFGNDDSLQWCTFNNPSTFFSHRRDRISGRQAACIWLA